MKQIVKILPSMFMLLLSNLALAGSSPWSIGVVTSYAPVIYPDTDPQKVVMPVIGYEGKHLFLRGLSAGVRLYPMGSSSNLIFRLKFDPRTLKPTKSDDPQIQKLNERKSSVLGGVSYQINTALGLFELGAGTDLGNNHNGLYVEGAWRLPIRMNNWVVMPEVGYAYNSDRINDYLYGVSKEEANRTGLAEFHPSWDGQYFVGLSATFLLSEQIRFTGAVRYTNLDSELEKSPIVKHSAIHSASFAITYHF